MPRRSLVRVDCTKSGEPMPDTWEEAVLRIVKTNKGAISLQEIYRKLESHPLVTPYHRELWTKQPYYHHWIRAALGKLKNRGAIQHVGLGLYISN